MGYKCNFPTRALRSICEIPKTLAPSPHHRDGQRRRHRFRKHQMAPENSKTEEDDDDGDFVPMSHFCGKKRAVVFKYKENKEDEDDEEDMTLCFKAENASASKAKEVEDDGDGNYHVPLSWSKKPTSQQKIRPCCQGDMGKVKKEKGDVEKVKKEKGDMDKVKKEKKVYALPGQKHDPPAERDPLRIFYESLYDQVPTSEMAANWLMEWGLLPLDVATAVFEKKQGQKLKSPMKTTSAKRKPDTPTKKAQLSSAAKTNSAAKDSGKTTAKKKRRASSDTEDDDDDFEARITVRVN
uniref:Uncharacterized protein n=1 Tax=Leersia perrieri TaxID=77586 RepID=A0A0D9VRX2_9ORYZ